MEGPGGYLSSKAEGYEEHPDENDLPDAYSTMIYPKDIDLSSVERSSDPMPSPLAGQANKMHYLFFNPPPERLEEDMETNNNNNNNSNTNELYYETKLSSCETLPSIPCSAAISRNQSGLLPTISAPRSGSGVLPKAQPVEPASLGYELQEFTESGYVGSDTLSGYLNFGNLKDDDDTDASQPSLVTKKEPSDEESDVQATPAGDAHKEASFQF
jgi:hypothetical protein